MSEPKQPHIVERRRIGGRWLLLVARLLLPAVVVLVVWRVFGLAWVLAPLAGQVAVEVIGWLFRSYPRSELVRSDPRDARAWFR